MVTNYCFERNAVVCFWMLICSLNLPEFAGLLILLVSLAE